MEYLELLKNRYSCRKFKDIDVSDDLIDKILEAAILSPTAVNFEPQKIYVIRNKELLAKLSTATKYLFDAKLVFVIAYDKNISWKRKSDNKEFGNIDAAIVTTNMMNMIHTLGLGCCMICSMHQDRVEDILELPKNIEVLALLPTGYPDEESSAKKRKNKEEIVEYR